MKISEEDYNELCDIAQKLNEDDSYIDLWQRLADVIENIKRKE